MTRLTNPMLFVLVMAAYASVRDMQPAPTPSEAVKASQATNARRIAAAAAVCKESHGPASTAVWVSDDAILCSLPEPKKASL